MYDSVIPKILTETFRLNETISGAIMAAGQHSGAFSAAAVRRALRPHELPRLAAGCPSSSRGTACAAVLMNLLPLLDNRYAAAAATGKLVGFVVVLGLLLVAMGTYRSPAVALMPDVTPKPLRSRANAIINLMGAVGGIIVSGCGGGAVSEQPRSAGPRARELSAAVSSSCRRCHARWRSSVLYFTMKEPKLAAAETARYEAAASRAAARGGGAGSGSEVLPKPVKRSLVLLLVLYRAVVHRLQRRDDVVDDVCRARDGAGPRRRVDVSARCDGRGHRVATFPWGSWPRSIGRKKTIQGGVCPACGVLLRRRTFSRRTIRTSTP